MVPEIPPNLCIIYAELNSPARFQLPVDERLRRELEIAPTDVVVGFIGRLEEQKGVAHLLHAVAALSKDFTNIKVVIAGEGSWKQRLQDEASGLGLRNVLFLGFRRDTPQLLRMFDVFVLPSLFEGLPVVLIEAMAAGCAVVATRIGGVEEVVVDGFNGILVQPGNSQSHASAVRSIITVSEMRKRLGEQAQRHAAQEFSAKVMVERTEDVYREMLPQLFEAIRR
ncbi:MAG: glycosyltransferase family 4 protein [Bryobacteraceae bacterium]|nr:glycosyltransferase family 4 protein [Bryobacteraceae bacterium]